MTQTMNQLIRDAAQIGREVQAIHVIAHEMHPALHLESGVLVRPRLKRVCGLPWLPFWLHHTAVTVYDRVRVYDSAL